MIPGSGNLADLLNNPYDPLCVYLEEHRKWTDEVLAKGCGRCGKPASGTVLETKPGEPARVIGLCLECHDKIEWR